MAKLSLEELAQQYGFAAAFFNADPELAALIKLAVKEQWSVGKFQAKFMNTEWYRSREASIRQWTDLSTRDPAEAENKISERLADLEDRFSQLGIEMDPNEIRRLAEESLKYSWSEGQLANVVGTYAKYVPGSTGGGIAAYEAQINNLAYQYGVSVGPDQMQQWITGLVNKSFTEDSITDFVRDAAKSKYAGLQAQLDSGRTTRDIAGQHITEFARLLEVDPGGIDLNDPVLASALQGTVDPKTGLPVPQTVFQMSQAVKKDKRWLGTKNARDDMVNATFGIFQDMGLV